jgi:hypothetical protein
LRAARENAIKKMGTISKSIRRHVVDTTITVGNDDKIHYALRFGASPQFVKILKFDFSDRRFGGGS